MLRLAVSTALLAWRAHAQLTYQSCAAIDPSTLVTQPSSDAPNTPETCAITCNGLGYTYVAVNSQFCACAATPPTLTKVYTDENHSDCSYGCQDPYACEYCGGIDISSFEMLYSYYISPLGSVTSPSACQSIGTPAAPTSEPVPVGTTASILTLSIPAPVEPTTPTGPVFSETAPIHESTTAASYTPSSVSISVIFTSPAPVTLTSSSVSTSVTSGPDVPPKTIVLNLGPGSPIDIDLTPLLDSAADTVAGYTPYPNVTFLTLDTVKKLVTGTVPADYTSGPVTLVIDAVHAIANATKRQAGTPYTFNIVLAIAAVPASVTDPASIPTATISPGAPTGPGPAVSVDPALPEYTSTVFATSTSLHTVCPECEAEATVVVVAVGTTCFPARVFTSPCSYTATSTCPNGDVETTVLPTVARITYNPAESTTAVVVVDETSTQTVLVAVTRTVQLQQQAAAPTVTAANGLYGNATNGTVVGGGSLPTYAPTAGAAGFGERGLVGLFVSLAGLLFGAVVML